MTTEWVDAPRNVVRSYIDQPYGPGRGTFVIVEYDHGGRDMRDLGDVRVVRRGRGTEVENCVSVDVARREAVRHSFRHGEIVVRNGKIVTFVERGDFAVQMLQGKK